MELARLIEALNSPDAYPGQVGRIEVKQTHISVVLLVGPHVYKIKKPVAPGFLDFTSLDNRFHFCREEVRLNRRLAPDVYLDVVQVVDTPLGVRVEATGDVIEWAVKMRRLPEDATLLRRVLRGEASPGLIEAVAVRIADFHQRAETNERIASHGRFHVVAKNIRDVFERAAPKLGDTVSRGDFDRINTLAAKSLDRLRSLIESRACRGMTRDCHGDLHLDHIYCFPDQQPPGDLVIIDCIEFNEAFRFIDPVADMAFVVMDLAFRGRRDLARTFADAYFHAARDEEGRSLLPLYTAARSAIRALVDVLLLAEQEVPPDDRARAHARAREHWLLALTELETGCG